jgi:hypothetical protein
MRWYNPALEDYEWRDVPRSDNEALQLFEGSTHTATCIYTYQEWRKLGASIAAGLIRAGEAAENSTTRTREKPFSGPVARPARGGRGLLRLLALSPLDRQSG